MFQYLKIIRAQGPVGTRCTRPCVPSVGRRERWRGVPGVYREGGVRVCNKTKDSGYELELSLKSNLVLDPVLGPVLGQSQDQS